MNGDVLSHPEAIRDFLGKVQQAFFLCLERRWSSESRYHLHLPNGVWPGGCCAVCAGVREYARLRERMELWARGYGMLLELT